ncbi:putative cytochrome p450 protein [Neofusicoccum parvum UCRNP2]|uniref:Putative cytochrome p450 protein n=1 Tax=Botryosphaeria parva (strain UCR-NP2) TaxID=1287680 RepID=R1E6N6_BOTPV|nr:putative cytochrome p450 protein [Neofusicoccum parvum UCRNP2]
MTVSFFAATDIKLHRHLRSRVSGAYSMTSILAMEPLVQDVADALWDRLRTLAGKEQPVALHLWAKYFAFDVVGQLALGGRIGFVQQGCDVDGIIASINDGFYLMANMGNVLGQMSWINNPLTQWAIRTLGGRRLNAFSVFLAWLEKRVDERMAGSGGGVGVGKRRDMLQHFIDAKDTAGFPVTKADVMIEGVNILGAGADTTSIGILACLELFKFTAQFLRHFDAELLNPEKPWETKTQWFSMQSNFWIRLKTRDVSQIKNQC